MTALSPQRRLPIAWRLTLHSTTSGPLHTACWRLPCTHHTAAPARRVLPRGSVCWRTPPHLLCHSAQVSAGQNGGQEEPACRGIVWCVVDRSPTCGFSGSGYECAVLSRLPQCCAKRRPPHPPLDCTAWKTPLRGTAAPRVDRRPPAAGPRSAALRTGLPAAASPALSRAPSLGPHNLLALQTCWSPRWCRQPLLRRRARRPPPSGSPRRCWCWCSWTASRMRPWQRSGNTRPPRCSATGRRRPAGPKSRMRVAVCVTDRRSVTRAHRTP